MKGRIRDIPPGPRNPHERAAWFSDFIEDEPDDLPVASLIMVQIHAPTALRARRACLAALARQGDAATMQALREASVAAIALYLTARAAQHYCELVPGSAGPIGRDRLDRLVSEAEQMRDCVIHWDGKAHDKATSFINVSNIDLVFVASDRKRHRRLAGISWDVFEDYVSRIQRWAKAVLKADHPGET